MLRMRTSITAASSVGTNDVFVSANKFENGRAGDVEKEPELEVRPGGMLVQKRKPDSERSSGPPPPIIRVRVKYGSTYHEIAVSSDATFGDLKKRLSGPTGLHHQDQKIYYKDKERDSTAFLDMAGVKDKSKLLLVEDPISHEKRLIEMRKNAMIEKASKSISQISLEVDRLAAQVSALENITSKGKKVVEKDVVNLIELLMNQLLKLDGVVAEGDAKLQRKIQVRRVQKCVETLDVIKAKNQRKETYEKLAPIEKPAKEKTTASSGSQVSQVASSATVVTTLWETFDAPPAFPAVVAPNESANDKQRRPEFPWDFEV